MSNRRKQCAAPSKQAKKEIRFPECEFIFLGKIDFLKITDAEVPHSMTSKWLTEYLKTHKIETLRPDK